MNTKSILFLFSIIIGLHSCNTDAEKQLGGKTIIERSIEAYGGEAFYNSVISFQVDDLDYKLRRENHLTDFTVNRQKDSFDLMGRYRNGHLEYYIDGELQQEGTYNLRILRGKLDGFTYINSIPHNLIQNAITLTQLPDVKIRNKPYLVVEAIWTQIDDQPQDALYLYIEPETYKIHYSSEQIEVTGGNPIFKRYYNFQEVNGLLFSDYYAFVPKDSIALDQMYPYFERADLRELDHIQLTNIEVQYP